VDREAVESGDVAIEEDDGDAGPIRMLLLRHVRKMILPDLCLMRTAEVSRAPEDHRATDRAAAARAALADLAVMKKRARREVGLADCRAQNAAHRGEDRAALGAL